MGSQHPSSKGRQETALGKRKRKPLGSGSSGHGVRPGGVAGGGEESLAGSTVGSRPTPLSPAFSLRGLSTLMAPHAMQPVPHPDLGPPGTESIESGGRASRCAPRQTSGVSGPWRVALASVLALPCMCCKSLGGTSPLFWFQLLNLSSRNTNSIYLGGSEEEQMIGRKQSAALCTVSADTCGRLVG